MMQEIVAADFWPFIKASNAIEGVTREGSNVECAIYYNLLDPNITITPLAMEAFVKVIAGVRNRLRDVPGLNVRVGNHTPPLGGPHILEKLQHWIAYYPYWDPIVAYARFQNLHPFTDGNGRLGRALYLRHKMERGESVHRLFQGQILEDLHYSMLQAFDSNAWHSQGAVTP